MAGISGDYDNPWTWLRAARAHEEQGDLQRALFEYRLARTVGHRDRTILEDLQRVESKIEERATALLKEADSAAARGDAGTARTLYLEILGLRPDDREALAALRKQDEKQVLLSLEKKRDLAKRNLRNGRTPAKGGGYADEGYSYSREAILDAGSRPSDPGQMLQELERHLEKYPKDKELRRMLIDTSLAQAEKSFRAQRLDDTLGYLAKAEQASKGDEAQRQAVADARKGYARELYSQGVVSFRSEPQKALNYWRYALKFDPQHEKSRLRIRGMTQM